MTAAIWIQPAGAPDTVDAPATEATNTSPAVVPAGLATTIDVDPVVTVVVVAPWKTMPPGAGVGVAVAD